MLKMTSTLTSTDSSSNSKSISTILSDADSIINLTDSNTPYSLSIKKIKKSIDKKETIYRYNKTSTQFYKWTICKIENNILRIVTNKNNKFNTWVVPCFTNDAICIKHGVCGKKKNFESIIIDNHILLSSYRYSKNFIDLLKMFVDEINTHVIVPIYFQTLEDGQQKWLDCGISINGKCKLDEKYIDAMKREIAEEVGILVGNCVKKTMVSDFDEKFGVFYAREAKPYSSKTEIKFSSENDFPRKTVFSYVIGSFEECKDLVKKSRELYPSSEVNYGVAIVPIKTILNDTYLSKITLTK
jgi:hypothetical protein